jgi:hypothetical protein
VPNNSAANQAKASVVTKRTNVAASAKLLEHLKAPEKQRERERKRKHEEI